MTFLSQTMVVGVFVECKSTGKPSMYFQSHTKGDGANADRRNPYSDTSDEDNCSAATLAAYEGYCEGVAPVAVTCTSEFKVRTEG